MVITKNIVQIAIRKSVKPLKHRKKTFILLCVCLCLPIFSGCLRMERINPETVPKERLFFGIKEWNKGYHYDQFSLFPPIIIAASWAINLPFELIGDLGCLPYDLYVNAYCAWHPNIGYCIRFKENDKLMKLLDKGAKPTDSGSGPYRSPLTPEQLALKYENIEALVALWAHGLEMSKSGVIFTCEILERTESSVHASDIERLEFGLTTIKKIAEDDAWNYLISNEKNQRFLFNYLALMNGIFHRMNEYESFDNIPKNVQYENTVLSRRKEFEHAVIELFKIILDHGLNPNIPDVKSVCYCNIQRQVHADCARRVTLLDYVLHSYSISDELRQQLIAILKQHGAMTYVQLVEKNPNLPHLHTEGVKINPVFQPVVDILQNSPYAENYRLSNKCPEFPGDVLVVEAGVPDKKSKRLHYSFKVPLVKRLHPEMDVLVELPLARRMVFYRMASEEEYNHHQKKEVYKSAVIPPAPRWISDEYKIDKAKFLRYFGEPESYRILMRFEETSHSLPAFELYNQNSSGAERYFADREKLHLTYEKVQSVYDDYDLILYMFTKPFFTGKEKEWITGPPGVSHRPEFYLFNSD